VLRDNPKNPVTGFAGLTPPPQHCIILTTNPRKPWPFVLALDSIYSRQTKSWCEGDLSRILFFFSLVSYHVGAFQNLVVGSFLYGFWIDISGIYSSVHLEFSYSPILIGPEASTTIVHLTMYIVHN